MKKIFLCTISFIVLFFVVINVLPQRKVMDNNPFLLKKNEKPKVIAHRGGRELFPENTMVAFDGSMALGVDVLEMDVRLTKDNMLVIHHDETVDRTSNGSGKVIDYTYEELKELNFAANFTDLDGKNPYENKKVEITTIEEVISKYADRAQFIIEVKESGELGKKAADELIRILKKYNADGKTIVASFHDEIVEYMRENYSGLMTNSAKGEAKEFVIKAYSMLSLFYKKNPAALQIPTVEGKIPLDNKLLISQAHRKNIAVQYWTINDENEMRELIELGADGIMTDRPDLMKKLIEEMYE